MKPTARKGVPSSVLASERMGAKRERARLVALIGTSTQTRGGIGAVIGAYERHGLFDRWPVVHLVTHADGGKLHKCRRAVAAFARFVGLVASRRVLLVHVHAASNASFWRKCPFVIVSFLARRPVVFHLHGGGFIDFYARRCGPVRRRMVRAVLDRVSEVVVLSDEWRERISGVTRNRNVSVVANPVDPQLLRAPSVPPRRENVVLFLGRLERSKGVFELVDAIRLLREHVPAVRLWFAGDGERDALARHVERSGLRAVVQFHGWVDDEMKRRLLREATVYALPSYVEGLPMAILEAMAAGLPAVATRVGGIPGVVEDGLNGFLVEPGDIAAMAAAIARLLSDAELRARMGAASRDRINARFLPQQILREIDALYRRVGGVA